MSQYEICFIVYPCCIATYIGLSRGKGMKGKSQCVNIYVYNC